MRANWGILLLLALAIAYIALAIYGKYRTIRGQYHEAKGEPEGPYPQPHDFE